MLFVSTELHVETDMIDKSRDIIWFGFNIDLTDLSWSNNWFSCLSWSNTHHLNYIISDLMKSHITFDPETVLLMCYHWSSVGSAISHRDVTQEPGWSSERAVPSVSLWAVPHLLFPG